MIAVTCSARKGKDQFSLREMVNSTRVVSTLKGEREGAEEGWRERSMVEINLKYDAMSTCPTYN